MMLCSKLDCQKFLKLKFFSCKIVSGRVAAQLRREGEGGGVSKERRIHDASRIMPRRPGLSRQEHVSWPDMRERKRGRKRESERQRGRERARAREGERERGTVAQPVSAEEAQTKTNLEKRFTTARNGKSGHLIVNAGPRTFRSRGVGGFKAGVWGFRV